MSLFTSAFDSAGTRALAAAPLAGGSKKRKRPAGKDDQLRATQVNLAKLIERVEKGDVKEKGGNERLGQMGKKRRAESPPPRREGKKPFEKGDRKFDRKFEQGDRKGGKFDNKFEQGDKRGGKFDKGKFDKKPFEKKPFEKKPFERNDSKSRQDGKGKDKGKAPAKALPKFPKTDTPSKATSQDTPKPKAKAAVLPSPVVPKKAPESDEGLTDMQRQMKSKLEGARFRWINEQLYSTRSDEALEMMKRDPKIFADYHDAHRAQTASWPEPPLPYIVDKLKPLARGAVIADLGCGDADLAKALVPGGKVVLSYDLVGDSGVEAESGEGWVVRADFHTHIPLPGRIGGLAAGEQKKGKGKAKGPEIVDAVVCCLSLMGINWIGGIYEAARVLKQGGTFHVAEVTSRLVDKDEFISAVESFGFECEEDAQPSTHFTLFRFTKTAAVPLGPARGEEGWEERVKEGEGILTACVYKKR